ncbi:YgfZ/GcvT domain-containing protein [Rhodoligotrophos defluvii]|uniref:CAF17-like 4Fe-4S cluster assembly/insertion protein YgfZ n=1 Tax=Rhodoligotrophos defluvii TaxID=2561934 RepID=UPI0010C96564|nr:folate-binding protein YgfZ [Rhodoligotrophos defluvii]
MTSAKLTELTDRAVIRLSGGDTRKLLQKLLTVDFDDVSPERAGYGALLTPQGKIMFDFFVAQVGDAYLFDCAAAQKDDLIKRLIFYRLRAQMEITNISADHKVLAVWDGQVPGIGGEAGACMTREGGVLFRDPRVAEAGFRAILPRGATLSGLDATPATEADYHAFRIGCGLADTMADLGSGELFPHEANFDQFHGVDFAKGCYVGQEVVSRMEHRGTGARKRIVPVRAKDGVLATGDQITADGKAIGQVLSSAGQVALALVRLDRAEDASAKGIRIEVDGRPIQLIKPAWATFAVPTASIAA